jgi:hypothetical protein
METTQQSDINNNTLLSTSHPVLYSYGCFKRHKLDHLTQKQLRNLMHECVHCRTTPQNIPYGSEISMTLTNMFVRDDYKLINEFIQNEDVDLNCCQETCWLKLACRDGSYKIVEVMLKYIKLTTAKAADMIFASLVESNGVLVRYGNTALTISRYSPISSNLDVLLCLSNLKRQTVILLFESACSLGWTDAIEHIHKRCKELLNGSATIDYLLIACRNGHIEALKLLIEMGYRMDKNKYYLCIILCEKVDKIKEVISVLESHSDIKEQILGDEGEIVHELWMNMDRDTVVLLFEYFVPIIRKSSLISLSRKAKMHGNWDKVSHVITKYMVY